MKKAFVTGATGFLGTNLIEALIKEQWDITVFILPNEKLTYIDPTQVTCVRGNILDRDSLVEGMPEGNNVTVFHLAGMTSMWHKQDQLQYEVNVIGTKNVCEVAIEKNISKLVFTSSISAYGYHKLRVKENTISNAMTCNMNYNRTKYLSEIEVQKAILNGLNAVILNPCNIIGPYDLAGWSTLIISAHKGNTKGATEGIATFAHVQDIVAAHIKAAEVGGIGENYLLGGVEVSFKEVVTSICKILVTKPPLRSMSPWFLKVVMTLQKYKSYFDKKPPLLTYPRYKRLTGHIICDDSKAQKELGYKTTTLNKMLLDSFNWLKKEGVL